jgi:hypothetical protein
MIIAMIVLSLMFGTTLITGLRSDDVFMIVISASTLVLGNLGLYIICRKGESNAS